MLLGVSSLLELSLLGGPRGLKVEPGRHVVGSLLFGARNARGDPVGVEDVAIINVYDSQPHSSYKKEKTTRK